MTHKHMKRISAPKSWPILRKQRTWITRPKPGRSFDLSIALVNVLKDILGIVRNAKEARYILLHQGVFVNGRRVYDRRKPVGFMDVVSIPIEKKMFRISLSQRGKLIAVPVTEKEASLRIVSIKNKVRVKDKIQIACFDGTNVLVDKNMYALGDGLVLDQTNSIQKHLPLQVGASIMVISGKQLGRVGMITTIAENNIYFTDAENNEHSTTKNTIFVVGEKNPEVTLK